MSLVPVEERKEAAMSSHSLSCSYMVGYTAVVHKVLYISIKHVTPVNVVHGLIMYITFCFFFFLAYSEVSVPVSSRSAESESVAVNYSSLL